MAIGGKVTKGIPDNATDPEVGGGDTVLLQRGSSPYATGGGGVTFERKVAVQYLARLLTGDSASELGDRRRVVGVEFQQEHAFPVDDVIIKAACPRRTVPPLTLALGVRRSPKIVKSDGSTRKLLGQYVRAATVEPPEGRELLLGLVVSGPQPHAKQLAQLADAAAAQRDSTAFFDLLQTQGKFDFSLRDRLDHLRQLVEHALHDLDVKDVDVEIVQERTWQLLSKLKVLMPRLEPPDDTDWAAVVNSLKAVVPDADLAAASSIRDRLVALADDYTPRAATVDRVMLQRALGVAGGVTTGREQGRKRLGSLDRLARESVRTEIADAGGDRSMKLDRDTLARELLDAVSGADAVLVTGESGVGKSALAVMGLAAIADAEKDRVQVVCINLRQVPELPLSLEADLGAPLSAFLAELVAPQRILVIDGADAATEGRTASLRYLSCAAADSGVKVVAVTAIESKAVVRDVIKDCFKTPVVEHVVHPLNDSEITKIVDTFPELRRIGANARSREPLRRLVVVDLLVRGGVAGAPLTETDAMNKVWAGLVRRRENSDRGLPDARETALLRLAELDLRKGKRLDVVNQIDSTALDGLRRDGLLRNSDEVPYKVGPEFAHDEVRRYAIARVLLADGDPASRLRDEQAPRWALGAARLACQAWLAQEETPSVPLRGRLAKQQASFDALVQEGHGSRWGDVPSEALLTLADSEPILRDAWPSLVANNAAGLCRIARVVDQRLRDERGVVDIDALAPIIALLLDAPAPWGAGDYAKDLFRAWLRGHVIEGTAAGNPLRVQLRQRLVEECAAAEDTVREITDELALELLALLGPDLGDEGEVILRRIARDSARHLGPAVDGFLTGDALSHYRRGFLADLTEAYYLDDDKGSGLEFLEDGVRDHLWSGLGVPMASWNRGPFMALFQTDFSNGVAMLNRLLNHAARIRVRELTNLDRHSLHIEDSIGRQYRSELEVSGMRELYVGDDHVWRWYRGNAVGPCPCISALQALERVCDQLIEGGCPIKALVSLMLDGCQNLAMVGLIVGLLVRHLEDAGDLLDPYLAEPFIWHQEFARVTSEASPLSAKSNDVVAPDRRSWSLREAAMFLVVRASEERVGVLRALGEALIAKARHPRGPMHDLESADEDIGSIDQDLAVVHAWASSLDRSRYTAHETSGGVYIQATPPEDVVQALADSRAGVERAGEWTRLVNRYWVERKNNPRSSIAAEDLAADAGSARKLLENSSSVRPHDPWQTASLVSAAVLEAHFVNGVDLPEDALSFSARTVIEIGEGAVKPGPLEFKGTFYDLLADRSAARVIPLLLPAATRVHALIDEKSGSPTSERVFLASVNLARALADEVRLYLARGLDHVWKVSCAAHGRCHHELGWKIACEMMRYCIRGQRTLEAQQHRVVALKEPLASSLGEAAPDSILVSHLDAAIRALAPAAMAETCISGQAGELLLSLLATQRQSLLYYEREHRDPDDRESRALVSARALLTLAEDGDDTAIYEHIDAYANNSTLLGKMLRSLSAAAEETLDRAATAKRIWPDLVGHVLGLHRSGHALFSDSYHGERALAAVIPNPVGELPYLYPEVDGSPIVWWNPLELQPQVEAWLPLVAGNATCADQLVGFVRTLEPNEQVRVGLPWVAAVVLADPIAIASGAWTLAHWLIEMRPAAVDVGVLPRWQEVVDALVVAGNVQLAPYSD